MSEDLSIHHIRIASKERPTDRFLTVQVREGTTTENEVLGDLYFLVEIHNPWFPNSQIGQTIINTIAREYRRGESTSLLANFEGALRKTNQALSQITQNGETDWIGNLSSLVALVTDKHIHVAQTGRACGYLVRDNRVTEITEGLDEETNHHPLTTYTNITSGNLEAGDRVFLVSSDVAEHFTAAELKPILTLRTIDEAGRQFIRATQLARLRRINGFLLEAGSPKGTTSETLYQDQSLHHPVEIAKRLTQTIVLPAMERSQSAFRVGSQKTVAWSRDWLIPRLITWGKYGHKTVVHQTKNLLNKSRPVVHRVAKSVRERLPKQLTSRTKSALDTLETDSLTGKTIFRVHHYRQRQIAKISPAGRHFLKAITSLLGRVHIPRQIKLPTFRQLTRLQLTLLIGAILAIGIVLYSVSQRREEQVVADQISAATEALSEAKTSQQAGERAFILGQNDTAATKFTEAITFAQTAAGDSSNQFEAAQIITQSQAILDQLSGIQRIDESTPLAEINQSVDSLTALNSTLFLLTNTSDELMIVKSTSNDNPTSLPLPATLLETNPETRANQLWYVLGKNQSMMTINLDEQTTALTQLSEGTWPQAQAIAEFNANLYLLDTQAGQIWKHTQEGTTFTGAKAFLKSADPTNLGKAIDLAIDGDIFVLFKDGSVEKYSKGEKVNDWQLTSLPKHLPAITQASQLFASPDTSFIYLFEKSHDGQAARLIAFDKDGTYVRQFSFPSTWLISTLSFDPNLQAGFVVSAKQIFNFHISLEE